MQLSFSHKPRRARLAGATGKTPVVQFFIVKIHLARGDPDLGVDGGRAVAGDVVGRFLVVWLFCGAALVAHVAVPGCFPTRAGGFFDVPSTGAVPEILVVLLIKTRDGFATVDLTGCAA